jgi:hypothetical protein
MVADIGPGMVFPTLTWAYATAAETDPGSCGSPRQMGVRLTPAVDGYRRPSVPNTCQSIGARNAR